MPSSVNQFANPFPPLNLSEEDKEQLHEYADSLLESHLEAYEDYLSESGDDLNDKSKWKYIRQTENIHVYARREDTVLLGNILRRTKPSNIKVGLEDETGGLIDMRAIGTINGTLEDFMNGAVATSLEDFRLKSTYLDDSGKKMCVLEVLKDSTPEEPFESYVIAYRTNEFDGIFNYIIKDMDFLYMHYTGYRTLRNGEKVGYMLLHSVSFPETSYLEGASWSNVAMTFMARQRKDGTLESFTRGMLETPNKMLRPVAVNEYAKAIANTAARHVECGIMRKLTWLVRLRSKESRHIDTTRTTCAVCESKMRSRAKACRLCYRLICNSCQVKKRMNVITPDDKMSKPKIVFCSPCLHEAVRMDAMALRGDEVRAKMSTDASANTMSASFPHSIASSD